MAVEGPEAQPWHEDGNPSGSGPRRRSKSMHDGIAVWCDCCSCEMEPYWAEVAAEMGVDPGSDYEDHTSD